MLKRVTDVIAAGAGLLLLAPVLGLTALSVRLAMGRGVLFRQERVGKGGKRFQVVKFRTMREGFGPNGQPLSDSERLTAFGKFLRQSSIDELPQLWNVLKGEMSLVGPRPLLPEYLALYTPEQARRHHVRPGVTGWTQVNGRNALDWDEKFLLDVWYVDHQSFSLDMKILLMTAKKVCMREGISQAGFATMEKFTGSVEKGKV